MQELSTPVALALCLQWSVTTGIPLSTVVDLHLNDILQLQCQCRDARFCLDIGLYTKVVLVYSMAGQTMIIGITVHLCSGCYVYLP